MSDQPTTRRAAQEPQVEALLRRVIDVIDSDTHIRLYIPNGEVTERGEVTYANNGEALSYPVTITCYPVDDVLLTKFSDAVAWA